MFRITRDCASLHVGTGPQEPEARSPRDTYSPVLTALLLRAKTRQQPRGPDDHADKHDAASHVVGQYPTPEGENKLAHAVTGMDLKDTVVGEMSQPQHKQHATHSREGPRPVRPTGTGRRRWVQALGDELLRGIGFQYGKLESSGGERRWWPHEPVNAVNAQHDQYLSRPGTTPGKARSRPRALPQVRVSQSPDRCRSW